MKLKPKATRKPKETALNLHMRHIAKKGGFAVKKKYGKDYYKKMADARWAAHRARVKAEAKKK